MEKSSERFNIPRWVRVVAIGRNPKFTLLRIVLMIAVAFLGRSYVLLPIWVKGPSMLPTYPEAGLNFVNRLAYVRSEPQRGDVVAIRLAGESVMFMKRVVALPGETLGFRRGRAIVNGEELHEPYMDFENFPCDWEMAPKTLGPTEYYVVGDNRTMPRRLHEQGKATRDRIVGKILLCKNWFVFLARQS